MQKWCYVKIFTYDGLLTFETYADGHVCQCLGFTDKLLRLNLYRLKATRTDIKSEYKARVLSSRENYSQSETPKHFPRIPKFVLPSYISSVILQSSQLCLTRQLIMQKPSFIYTGNNFLTIKPNQKNQQESHSPSICRLLHKGGSPRFVFTVITFTSLCSQDRTEIIIVLSAFLFWLNLIISYKAHNCANSKFVSQRSSRLFAVKFSKSG